MMRIRADSLAAHGAKGGNGGDVRLGELHEALVEALEFALECAEKPVHDVTARQAKGERLMTTLRAALKLAKG